MILRRSRSLLLAFVALGAMASNPVLADSADLIRAAQSDIAAGNPDAAFARLAAEQEQYAGEVEFDYWMGVAANRAGKASQALFALERVLAMQPNHAAARLELAVAYARLNLGEAARRELDILDGQNPPPAARKQIDELRRQLGLGDQARRLMKRVAFVTLEGGYDDNAGTYPKDLGFPGLPSPDEIESPYLTLAAGMRQRVDLKSNRHLNLSANGQFKRFTDSGDDVFGNDDATQFDQDFLGGRGELVFDHDGRRETAVGVDLGYLKLDGEHYYTYYGADAEWREQRSAATRTLFTIGLRNMQFENDAYDNLQSRVRIGARHRLNAKWSLTGDVSLEYEAATNSRQGGDALRATVSGSAVWQFRPAQRLSADLNLARTDYTTDYAVLGARSDDRIAVGINWDRTIQRFWQLRARLQYRDQDSTLDTYTFDQTSGSVSLTRYF